MPDRYQDLRDAIAAGPTPGPWAYEPHGDTNDYGVGVLYDEHDRPQSGRCEPGKFLVVDPVVPELHGQTNAAYIAAADPDTIDALLRERNALREALTELYAAVKGECPSLLDEDRGGSARLDMAVSAALADGGDA